MTGCSEFVREFFRRPWTAPCALFLLALLVYANSFPGAFILDDVHLAKNNPHFFEPDLLAIFRSDYWYGFQNSGVYRPLTILSLLVNRALLGSGPLGFHLVNVLLHGGVVVLFWHVLRGWQFPAVAAFLAAGLFAVHPLHVDAINVVVYRSELLVALFLLAGFIAARREGLLATSAVCLCYLLALLSKEHAVTFLALLPLYDMFSAGPRAAWRRNWPRYAALLTIAVVWWLWHEHGIIDPLPRTRLTESAAPLAYVDTLTRVLTALQLQGLYFYKLLLGVDLQAAYSRADLPPFIVSLADPRAMLVCVAALLTAGLLGWGWRRRSSLALFGLLYLISFSPTSNVFMPIGVTFAERLTYLPSIWFCAAGGWAWAILLNLNSGYWRRLAWGTVALVLLWFGGMTVLRNSEYGSEVQLWSAEVQNNPYDYLGWQSLAESYANIGQWREADEAYRQLLALAPDYPGGLRSRTCFLLLTRRYAEALETASRVYALSRAGNDPQDIAFDGLDMAEIHLALGNSREALAYLERPEFLPLLGQSRFYELRGKALANLERDVEAVEAFAMVTADLVGSDTRYYHGRSLFRLGRLVEARQQLERAVRAKSDGPSWNLLGVVCARLGDLPAARTAFEMALTLDPANTYYRDNLEKSLQGSE